MVKDILKRRENFSRVMKKDVAIRLNNLKYLPETKKDKKEFNKLINSLSNDRKENFLTMSYKSGKIKEEDLINISTYKNPESNYILNYLILTALDFPSTLPSYSIHPYYSKKGSKVNSLLLKDKGFNKLVKAFIIELALTNEYRETIIKLTRYASLFTLYVAYIISQDKLTSQRARNLLRILYKDFDFRFEGCMKDFNSQYIQEITTGVKYEKFKPVNNSNYPPRSRNKSNKNSFDTYVDNQIKIRYRSKKDGKHLFHKSPKEHIRSAHMRTLPNGKTILIPERIINSGTE